MLRQVSLRESFAKDSGSASQLLSQYVGDVLRPAFPFPGETEEEEVYRDYLTGGLPNWDAHILYNESGEMIGGIQGQILDVGQGPRSRWTWLEHLFFKPSFQRQGNLSEALELAKQIALAAGAWAIFGEHNNPREMTAEEIEEDAQGGLPTLERLQIWAKESLGIHVLVVDSGERPMVPYAQVGMGDQAPVTFLGLQFIGLSSNLAEEGITAEEYLKLYRTAMETIPGIDYHRDSTCRMVQKAVTAVASAVTGPFVFVPFGSYYHREISSK